MKLLTDTPEREWYLVREWITKAGLPARIHYCKWKNDPTKYGLHHFYTGYVQIREGDKHDYYVNDELNVHGGVTFFDSFENLGEDITGKWVGFDLAHLGDERFSNPAGQSYTEEECESLAKQLVDKYNGA